MSRRMRALWCVLALLLSLVVVPATVGGSAQADNEPPAACAASGGSCSVTFNGTSVTMTFTVNRANPECTGGLSTNCVYSYQLQRRQSGFNSTGSTLNVGGSNTTCSGTTPSSLTFGDFRAEGLASFSCTTVFTWNTSTEYPTAWSVNIIEQDGGGSITPGGGHGFSTSRPAPHPHAAFTYTQGTPCTFTFTSTSTTRAGKVFETWYSPPNDALGIPPSGAVGQKVWTHTFPKPGTYSVRLSVSDSGPYSEDLWKDVTCGAATGSSTTLTVKLALSPKTDSGRFKIVVDGKTAIASAKHGSSKTLNVKPGRRVVTVGAVSGTSLTKYGVKLTCTVNGKNRLSSNSIYGAITLKANDRAICTFTNTRTKVKHCIVPNVVGKTLASAKTALISANCEVGKLTPARPNKSAKVTSTSPSRGAVRANDTKVALKFT